MFPKVTILWVNCNSSSFLNIALDSLKAIRDFDYANFELIIVDNNSTDGSFTEIENFLKKERIDCKTIALERNLGFTGGNNVAYSAKNTDSRYVILLNNDAVPTKESLSELVDIMENDPTLGASQGVILNFDGRSIDTAGDYLSELLEATSLFKYENVQSLKKPIYSTSADAAFSIFRVNAINSLTHLNGKMFDDLLFGYFDDHMLGLRLWNNSFKVKVFPIVTARHQRGSSFGKKLPLQVYLYMRNLVILNEITNSRYRDLIRLSSLRKLSSLFFARILGLSVNQGDGETVALSSKAFTDGLRIGRAKRLAGDRIDLYKAPILEVQTSTAFLKTAISNQIAEHHLEKALSKIAV